MTEYVVMNQPGQQRPYIPRSVKELLKNPSTLNRAMTAHEKQAQVPQNMTEAANVVMHCIKRKAKNFNYIDEEYFSEVEQLLASEEFKEFLETNQFTWFVFKGHIIEMYAQWIVSDSAEHLPQMMFGDEYFEIPTKMLTPTPQSRQSTEQKKVIRYAKKIEKELRRINLPQLKTGSIDLESQLPPLDVSDKDDFIQFAYMFGHMAIHAAFRSMGTDKSSYIEALQKIIGMTRAVCN